jgi:hypothetical protein
VLSTFATRPEPVEVAREAGIVQTATVLALARLAAEAVDR